METCNRTLIIADDYGDNHATIKCQREAGHDGSHSEEYDKDGGVVLIVFDDDAAEVIPPIEDMK